MPDLLYLNLWLQNFGEQNMLTYWKQAIEEFPCSSQAPGIAALAVYPLDWNQPAIMEDHFPDGGSAEEAFRLAQEFLHADCAYEARVSWDLWVPKSEDPSDGWERKPHGASIVCLGAQFGREGEEDSGHLEINFGPEENFLPPEVWDLDPEEKREAMTEPQLLENINKLVNYVRRLEESLPVARRRPWSESGNDLPSQILSIWEMES
jgi:hypothetical protein